MSFSFCAFVALARGLRAAATQPRLLTALLAVLLGSLSTTASAHELMNAGGEAYLPTGPEFEEEEFEEDAEFVPPVFEPTIGYLGGSPGAYAGEVANTIDDELYLTTREGASFSYVGGAAVPGKYEILMWWMEPTATEEGERVFDVSVEGFVEMEGHDIFEEAGGGFTAMWEEVIVTVLDGQIEIDFTGVVGDAIVSAVSIEEQTEDDADIGVFPPLLDLGPVGYGSSETASLTILNDGAEILTVTGLASDNGAFTVVSPAVPFDLAPAATQEVVIEFEPTGFAPATAELTITSNDPTPGEDSLVIPLSGEGVMGDADIQFTDVSAFAGVGSDYYWAETVHSLGVNWIDYDRDGYADLFMVNGEGLLAHLYHNETDGTFSPADDLLPVLPDVEMSGSVFADVDNDGDSDIYIFTDNGFWPGPLEEPQQLSDGPANLLLLNQYVENGEMVLPGQPLFIESAGSSASEDLADPSLGDLPGMRAKSGGFLDYDRDGCVDLYVGHLVMDRAGEVSNRDRLLRNMSCGVFADVTGASGVDDGTDPGRWRPALGFIGAHFDADLWPDMYTVNVSERQPSPWHHDQLYQNQSGGFADTTALSPGLGDDVQAGMGIDLADVDLDGAWDFYVSDILVTDLDATPPGNPLYLGLGDGTFLDNSAPAAGVSGNNSWGVNFFDVDKDGDEDLYVATSISGDGPFLFLNDGTGTFTEIAASAGLTVTNGRGSAVADYDQDGDLDLAVVNHDGFLQLFRNDTTFSGNGLQVRLEADTSNRDAIGAMVEIEIDERLQMRQIEGGSSAHSQDELLLQFGLGSSASVDRVTVYWPSGVQDEFYDVAAGSLLTVVEASSEPPARADVRILPNAIDFGVVSVSADADRFVVLSNRGTLPLTVSDLSTNAADFSVLGPATPFDIAPGETARVDLRFTPSSAGVQAAVLEVLSDDDDEPTKAAPLIGAADEIESRRINAGGLDLVTVALDTYVADRAAAPLDFGYVGGTGVEFGGDVAGTDDDALYNTFRGGGSFSYVFDGLAAGDYEVTLHFNEPFASSIGQRVQDVSIEGTIVLDDFDIFATAGGGSIAHDETFDVSVTDGALDVDFQVVVSANAIVSAIAVVALDPPTPEDCGNAVDDDGDGFVDCADSDCVGDPACVEDCSNGADDDLDGDVDCDDSDCAGDPACIEGDCGNGADDDGDGLIDCADPDCVSDPSCIESDCSNGVDDDGDGATDCADSDCASGPSCVEGDCSNGVDDDGDGATDCADSDCASGPPCIEAGACADDVDNDSDGDTDCLDSDCTTDPVCDPDDDGILSPVDNCPDDWNPLQGDINGDGIGDACQPDDFDGDGWPDVDDNCPDDENQDQLDGDGNGVGDVCDGWSMARKWNEQLLHAIRNDLARPTVHARNLYHVSAAMWDAWAAYDPSVSGIFQDEDATAADVAAARDEAMAYAAYRVLVQRFTPSVGAETMLPRFDDKMAELGYDIAITTTIGDTPAAVGNRIAETIIAFGLTDGSNEANDYVNQYYEPVNPPLLPDFPGNPDIIDANRWQPLALEYFVDQSGNVIPGGFPEFLSPEWGQVVPFALSGDDLTIFERDGFDYWVYHDPGPPPLLAGEGDDYYKYGTEMVSVWSSHLDPTDGVTWDISPASIGNSPLPGPDDYEAYYDFENGGDWGTGHPINPITGLPYDPQIVPRGDYARVLAEFWADGPDSETPPGHWFSILNYVSDHPLFVKQMGGEGAVLPDLEWDVKLYLMMGGAMHDVAVTAWGAKGWYDYVRPISALRHITDLGQSSDPGGPSYHPDGIGLRPGFIEVVTAESSAPGERHEELADGIGKIAILAWRGPDAIGNEQTDTAGVGWILAENWWPYQRPSFVTPPFAGYVSGHSTFSRAASELMTVVTGSKYFPGGLGEFPAPQDEFLVFEDGPSQTITLQWATYHDASDQTSLSRIWGGIHPPADDLPGRLMGQDIGRDAVAHAQAIFGQARCSDLIDNDEDGLTDLEDPDCTDANDQSEASGPPLVERRMSCGGLDYTATDGDVFDADRAFVPGDFGYVSGEGVSFGDPVDNTDDDLLYQTMRGGPSFAYVFDALPVDDYQVTLHFNDPFASGTGQRLIDVTAEGLLVLDDLDVFAVAGGNNTAHVETFVATVTDGALDVVLDVVVSNNAILSAIEIVSLGLTLEPEDCGNGLDEDDDGLVDCDDPDCDGDPACIEDDCGNGADDDGDGLTDCFDSDCVGDPACVEGDCGNGVDDDGDGLTDCVDPDCAGDPACIEGDCGNGLDDDGDGLTDCFDSDCAGDPACVEDCSNGSDDDADGLTDCEDPDCESDPACIEGDCVNGIDDDGDGLTDCFDPDCAGDPACVEDCGNGTDDDGDGLSDCDDPDCDGDPACIESDCVNGIDDDGDGLTDCLDSDCAGEPACVEDCGNGTDDDGDGLIDCDDSDCAGDQACAPPVNMRMNSGGLDYTTLAGDLFEEDRAYSAASFGYVGGQGVFFGDPIAGTDDDLLYQGVRGGPGFSYWFDVPAGDYQLELHFSEPFQSSAGGRLFDVSLEGVVRLDNYDVFAEAGGQNTAVVETLQVTVTDGRLEVDLAPVVGNNAIISALALTAGTPEPNAAVQPPALGFSDTAPGGAETEQTLLSNDGAAVLTVTALSTTDPAFAALGPLTPFDLAPGESRALTVQFSPSGLGPFAGDLVITSNDPDEGALAVPLSGEGVSSPTAVAYRLNAGGAALTDTNGDAFLADQAWSAGGFGYVGGSAGVRTGDVSGDNDDLYTAKRQGASFSYQFDGLPVDDYEIRLYFSDPDFDVPGLREFDVSVEGELILDDFDIRLAAHNPCDCDVIAYRETILARVTDGQLNVDFALETGPEVTLSAIAVVPARTPPLADYQEVSAEVGLVQSHELDDEVCIFEVSTGSAWGDYNLDGLVDLYVTVLGGPNHLYRNDGDNDGDGLPEFTDVAAAAGVDDAAGVSHSSVFIDYDNDGDQDLYVTDWSDAPDPANKLYQNQLFESGTPTFLDVTAFAGVADGGRAITTAWGDYDGDGFLDFYVVKHYTCRPSIDESDDTLWRANGDGTFSDVTDQLCGGAAPCPATAGLGFTAGWVDHDDDGDLDLYLVNDDINGTNGANRLWRNDGPDGSSWLFTEVSASSGTDQSVNGMGLGIGDYMNEGLPGFSFTNQSPNTLLRQRGDGTFEDVSAIAGIQRGRIQSTGAKQWSWASAMFDHDADGWLDVLFAAGYLDANSPAIEVSQPNAFFWNNGDGTFTDVSAPSGLDHDGRARNASIVDFDGDGFVDVFVSNLGEAPLLFHNRSAANGNSNGWLTITVEGTTSNRDGIGTRLTLTTPDGKVQMREITSGSSHGGGDHRAARFGLGDNATGDLTIRWPTGVVQAVGVVAADQALHYIEP